MDGLGAAPLVRRPLLVALIGDYLPPPRISCPSSDDNGLVPPQLETLRTYINDCSREHGINCEPWRGVEDAAPAWLIDLENKCLIQATKNESYVALSYVWGLDEQFSFKCRKGNLESLKQPGGLTKHMAKATYSDRRISHTVMDAITITKLLGFHYLWVDSLCIIQDDDGHLQTQLQHMDTVYSRAELTIVAAQGESSERGIHFVDISNTTDDGSAPLRNNLPTSTKFNPQSPYGAETAVKITTKVCRKLRPGSHGPSKFSPRDALVGSTWAMRGWTMQELLFSKRLLYFTDEGILWECHCVLRELDSEKILKPIDQFRATIPRPFHETDWPDLDLYAGAVMDYNERDLTFPTDALRAFAGVTTSLEKVFPGGFLFGMPILFFDWALLWTTASRFGGQSTARKSFPTWSWISIQSKLDLNLWSSACDYILERGDKDFFLQKRGSLAVRPIVQFKIATRHDQETNLIQLSPKYDMHRHQNQTQTPNLPQEWTKNEAGDFQHISDPRTRFTFPLPSHSDIGGLPGDISTPYLYFLAQRAFFNLGRGRRWGRNEIMSGQRVVGVVVLDDESLFSVERIELIAISEGSVQVSTGDKRFEEATWMCLNKDAEYEFNNVLLVQWSDGIAYRRGLGRVEITVWQAADVEEIDVILG